MFPSSILTHMNHHGNGRRREPKDGFKSLLEAKADNFKPTRGQNLKARAITIIATPLSFTEYFQTNEKSEKGF